MNRSLTISTTPAESHDMDYAFLRQEGIDYLQKMADAGMPWTDFNAHDPGITILEQLCYAITDLGYRIAFELPDILKNNGGDPYESLYSAARILTSQPVTLTDLRKLALDVEGVKNVWIEPVEEPSPPLYYHAGDNMLTLKDDPPKTERVHLKGLYSVLIEKADVTDINGTVVQREVTRRLHANRNLCEDFAEIRLIKLQDIQVHANIEIDHVDDIEELLLRIYEKISDYISPSVHFASLDEMIDKNKSIDEIFEGPRLEHGFLDSEALQRLARRTTINTSDLIHEIMDVSGVRAVNHIRVSSGMVSSEKATSPKVSETETQAWSFEVAQGYAPRLDVANSMIILERENLAVAGDKYGNIEAANKLFESRTLSHKLPARQWDIIPPIGRDREISDYYSIQHQFPASYGIGAMGLPASASSQRKAQARQLKAYLMFFDQLLANHFAQLGHVRDLFSFYGEETHTYFSQPIDDPTLAIQEVISSDPATHRAKLQRITNSRTDTEKDVTTPDRCRRNRFLNHLLAMFAEQFTDYSLVQHGVKSTDGGSVTKKVIHDKQIFLQNYPQLSSARGVAFNYLQHKNSENRSGLEDRLRRKLGLGESDEMFFVVEHILLRPMEQHRGVEGGDESQTVPILADPQCADPYSLQISFVFCQKGRFTEPSFKAFTERTVREETPAHLIATIHWLEHKKWNDFKECYDRWVAKRRDYWNGRFGT